MIVNLNVTAPDILETLENTIHLFVNKMFYNNIIFFKNEMSLNNRSFNICTDKTDDFSRNQ